MKKNIVCFIIPALLSLALAGCATGKPAMKATATSEVVTAAGMAPIVNGDTEGARKTALHDALKNALGLVIGVYVSQEALVSKSMLIEDNITSQTEGYIERYDVIKEWKEGDFFKTQVKALVRKEDLSAKIKAMDLEPKRLGNPLVAFAIDDLVDGNLSETHYAEDSLKKDFLDQGFVVSDGGKSDILISGRADASFNTDQGLGGLVSYRSALSVKAVKSGSEDVITSVSQTIGGVDATKDAAAKAAIIASAKRIGKDMPAMVLKYLKERSTVMLSLGNVVNYNKLNDFLLSLRAQIEVRDCKVRDYSNTTALIDVDVRRGTAADVAKRLEQLQSFSIKVVKVQAYTIEAQLQNKDIK